MAEMADKEAAGTKGRRDGRLVPPPPMERVGSDDRQAQLAALRVVLGLPNNSQWVSGSIKRSMHERR